jgi:hypothetical protein
LHGKFVLLLSLRKKSLFFLVFIYLLWHSTDMSPLLPVEIWVGALVRVQPNWMGPDISHYSPFPSRLLLQIENTGVVHLVALLWRELAVLLISAMPSLQLQHIWFSCPALAFFCAAAILRWRLAESAFFYGSKQLIFLAKDPIVLTWHVHHLLECLN